ncbi:hypothetical protein BGZ58_009725 [Dissophora ornata]|nr:hypothetical protein BGZ58_009725 [Dissophora ornata]
MHRLLNAANRSHPAANMNKPLPEPLVDPDEGKTPIGELVIVPIQGKDLPNRERFGKQDPFILFKLGNVSKRSSTDIRGGQRPRWKEDQINIFMYESDAKDATSLYVTCLDEDPQKNDLIGDCVINLARVLELGEQDDWFELSYKGREAGELMLQLTYYSYDPKHPTNKMNRAPPSTPVPGAPARRPIHPTKEAKKADDKPEDENRDEGPVYQPPVVPEPPAPAVPIVPVAGYPYGTMPAGGMGRPVSPSGPGGHYVGHHTPQIPTTANPYGIPGAIPPANPYATNPAAYAGYPAAAVIPTAYSDPSLAGADPSKRLSFTGQPQQPGGFLPAGYPPVAAAVPGYPPQVPVVAPVVPPVGAYPPHSPGFPPHSPGFPPQNSPYVTGASAYPQAPTLPITAGPPNSGGPPAGYPFAASGIYPPTNNNNGPGGPVGPGGYPAVGPVNNGFPGSYAGNNNNNNNNGGNSHPYGNNGVMNSHSNGNVNSMNNGGFNNNNNNNNGFNNNNGGNGFNNTNTKHSFNNGNNFNNNNSNGNNMNNFNNNNNNNNGNNFNNNNNNGNNFNNNNNNNNNNGGNNYNNNGGNNGNNFNNNTNNNNNGNNFNNNNNNYNNGSSFRSNNNNSSNNNNNHGGGYPSVTQKKTNTISPSPSVRAAENMYRPEDF